MTGIEAGKTWSRIGPEVVPTSSSASGVFTLSEYSENQGAGTWPNPAVGWMAYFKPSVYTSSWLYTQLMLDDSDNIYIGTIGVISGYTQTGIVKLNSDGAAVAAMYTTGTPSTFYNETKGLVCIHRLQVRRNKGHPGQVRGDCNARWPADNGASGRGRGKPHHSQGHQGFQDHGAPRFCRAHGPLPGTTGQPARGTDAAFLGAAQ